MIGAVPIQSDACHSTDPWLRGDGQRR